FFFFLKIIEKQRALEAASRTTAGKSGTESGESGSGQGGASSGGASKPVAGVAAIGKDESASMSVLRQWSLISSIELEVLHCLLFVNLAGLSNRMVRDLQKFKLLSFDSLDTRHTLLPPSITVVPTTTTTTTTSSSSSSSSSSNLPNASATTGTTASTTSSSSSSSTATTGAGTATTPAASTTSTAAPTAAALASVPFIGIRQVMDRIMTGSYRNPYLFVVGPTSSKSMHALWGIKTSEECVGGDCNAHLNS
ncbi:hypothetical protein RFI_18600, partial [Reticulomyxa filosa]